MDIQFILVLAIFVAALWYVGRIIYRSLFSGGDNCGSGCGKCGANFDEIQLPKK